MSGEFTDPAANAKLDKLARAIDENQAKIDAALKRAEQAVTRSEPIGAPSRPSATPKERAPQTRAQVAETNVELERQLRLERQIDAAIVEQIQARARAIGEARTQTEGLLGAAQRVERAGQTPNVAAIEQTAAALPPRLAPAPPSASATSAAASSVEQQIRTAEAAAAQAAAARQAAAQAASSAIGGQPAFTQAPPAPVRSLTDYEEELNKLTPAQQRAIALAAQEAQEESKLGAALSRNVQTMSLADNAFQRHGALTTEFITAAARGQVTIEEFGNQMVQTIGKFAGWTGAAALVYGALGAVTALGRGAVDASSGVQQLTRFIPDLNREQATRQTIQQVQDVNVPVKDVNQASGAFARIFKNQNDVFTASHVALLATKLDNIQLADSYRYLTSLTQEYGLQANQLPGVFDQISAAQNRLGARVSELLPALARSAAAVKNSGGDLNQLLALEATAIVRTGQTGNTVGTAFARGAANFYRQPTNEATLNRFGVDTNQGFTQALIQAIGLADRRNVSGEERRDISKAFFGPLRGGLLAGLFTSEPQVQRALAQTSPTTTGGAAQTELGHVLGQADQQLSALGHNLEAVGAALGPSGLLTPLGLLVEVFNKLLVGTTDILEVFGELPKPVRDSIGVLAVLGGARALAQRFDVGAAIPGPIGSVLRRDPNALQAAQITTGFEAERDFYGEQLRNTSRQAAVATLATQSAEQNRNKIETAFAAGENVSPEKRLAAQQAFKAALIRQAALEDEIAGLQQAGTAIEVQIVEFKRLQNTGLSAQEAALAVGATYSPGTLARGTFAKPVKLDQSSGGVILPAGVRSTETRAVDEAVANAGREAQDAAGALERARATVTGGIGRLGSGLSNLANGAAGAIGKLNPGIAALLALPFIYDAIKSGQDSVKQAFDVVNREPGGSPVTAKNDLARVRVEQYVARTNATADSFSTFLVDTNAAIDQGYRHVTDTISKIGAQVDRGGVNPGTTARRVDIYGAVDDALTQDIDSIQKQISNQRSTWTRLKEKAAGVTNTLLAVPGSIVPGDSQPLHLNVNDPLPGLKARQQADEKALADRARLFYSGQAAPYLPASTIQNQSQAAFDNFKAGVTSYGQMQAEFNKSLREVALNPALAPGTAQGLRALIADLRSRIQTSVSAIGQSLSALSSVQLSAQVKDYSNMLGLFGAQSAQGQEALRHLSAVNGELAARAAFDPSGTIDKSGTTNLDKFAQGQDQITSAIKQQVQADLTVALRVATTRQQRAAAYAAAGASVQRYEIGLKAQIAAQNAYIANAERQVIIERAEQSALSVTAKAVQTQVGNVINFLNNAFGMMQGIIGSVGQLGGITGTKAQALQGQLKDIRQHTNARDFLSGVQKQLDSVTKDTIAGYRGLGDKALNPTTTPTDPMELVRLRREIEQARAQDDPVASAGIGEQLAQEEIGAAKNERERLQGQLDLVNAEHQYDQAVQERTQAIFSYREALAANDPIQQAAIAVQAAAQDVAHQAAHGGTNTKAYYDALAKQAGAEQQLAKEYQNRIDARYQFLQSQTTDPVRQAQIDANHAAEVVRNQAKNGGTNTAAYWQARAQQNTANQKLLETRVTDKEDTIEFQYQLGQISAETAIQEYEGLLKVHGITKQLRRQVLSRIDELRKAGQSEFAALDLGTIRLPTPYEIRRAVQAAQAGIAVTNHNTTNIAVNDERAVDKVGIAVDRYQSGTYKSIKRAAALA